MVISTAYSLHFYSSGYHCMIFVFSMEGGEAHCFNKNNGRQTALHFTFDDVGRPKQGAALWHKAKPKKVRCCAVCLVALLAVALLAFGSFLVFTASFSQSLASSSANNVTIALISNEKDEFFESWEASPLVLEKVRVWEGKDQEGFAVWFIDFGRWDLGTLLERNETRQELDLYIEQLYYGFRKSVAPDGNSAAAGGWGMIVNMDDWTLGKALDFTVAGYLTDKLKQYMGVLKTFEYAIVINIPSWSRFIIEMMRPFWGETLDRFEMFGYDKWLPTVKSKIPMDQLPPAFSAYVTDDTEDGNWFSL